MQARQATQATQARQARQATQALQALQATPAMQARQALAWSKVTSTPPEGLAMASIQVPGLDGKGRGGAEGVRAGRPRSQLPGTADTGGAAGTAGTADTADTPGTGGTGVVEGDEHAERWRGAGAGRRRARWRGGGAGGTPAVPAAGHCRHCRHCRQRRNCRQRRQRRQSRKGRRWRGRRSRVRRRWVWRWRAARCRGWTEEGEVARRGCGRDARGPSWGPCRHAGTAGNAGTAGTVGNAGTAGTAGTAGNAGKAGGGGDWRSGDLGFGFDVGGGGVGGVDGDVIGAHGPDLVAERFEPGAELFFFALEGLEDQHGAPTGNGVAGAFEDLELHAFDIDLDEVEAGQGEGIEAQHGDFAGGGV